MYLIIKDGILSEVESIKDMDLEGVFVMYGEVIGENPGKGQVIKKVKINGQEFEVGDIALRSNGLVWIDNGKLIEIKNTDNLNRFVKFD